MTSHENISPRDDGFFLGGLFVSWIIASTRVVLGISWLLRTLFSTDGNKESEAW